MAHDDTEKPDPTLLNEACEAMEKAEQYFPHADRGPTREHRERYSALYMQEKHRARDAVRKLNPALSEEYDEAAKKHEEAGQRVNEAAKKSQETRSRADVERTLRAGDESFEAFEKMFDAGERYDNAIKALCTKPPTV